MVNIPDHGTMFGIVADYAYEATKCNKTILIMVTYLKDGYRIEKALKGVLHNHQVRFVSGRHSKWDRRQALDDLTNTGNPLKVLIATKIFEKGIDIPELDIAINMKLERSDIGTIQSLGRTLRGIKEKIMLDFFLENNDTSISKSRRREDCYKAVENFKYERLGIGEFIDAYQNQQWTIPDG